MVKWINRDGSEFTFTPQENGDIIWVGNFEHCRYGFPNVYKVAYEKYRKDGGKQHMEWFKEEVHRSIYENDKYVGPCEISVKYQKLIYPDQKTINMVDPMGGPYLTSGMDMKYINSEFSGLLINSFVSTKDGYLIQCWGEFDQMKETKIIGGIINTTE
jgi:hypothetical protein